MSAVRQFHIINGYPEPQKTPLLAASIKGVMVYSSPPSRKKPITTDILINLVDACKSHSDSPMLKATMCTLFLGCLRAGGLCVADQDNFSKHTNVCVKDITFHGSDYFELFLRKSKTDRFSMGATVVVGCSRAEPCTFCYMQDYMQSLPKNVSRNAPLFRVSPNVALKKSYFINALKLCLIDVNLNPSEFGGHSFRAGSASSASLKGFSD